VRGRGQQNGGTIPFQHHSMTKPNPKQRSSRRASRTALEAQYSRLLGEFRRRQTSKAAGTAQILPIPERKFESISIEFMGQLPRSTGYDSVMIIIDRLTSWLKLIPFDSHKGGQQWRATRALLSSSCLSSPNSVNLPTCPALSFECLLRLRG
jgi:hypothetical protein